MKKISILLFSSAIFFNTFLHAQSVNEVINKYVEAIGGKETLGKVKSLYLENTMDVMGSSAPQKEYLVEGKAYKNEVEFQGSSIVSCFTDKSGWTINPMMGATDAQAMPDELYMAGRSQIYLGGGLVDYASKGYKAELMGKEGDAFKIKLSDASSETLYFIDTKSYLLTKSVVKGEIMGQAVDITTIYSDHKKTDSGVVLPFTKNVDMGMLQITQKTDTAEINKEIDARIFEMPK